MGRGWAAWLHFSSVNTCQHRKGRLVLPALLQFNGAVTLTDNKELHHRGRSQVMHHGSNVPVIPQSSFFFFFPRLTLPFISSSHMLLEHHLSGCESAFVIILSSLWIRTHTSLKLNKCEDCKKTKKKWIGRLQVTQKTNYSISTLPKLVFLELIPKLLSPTLSTAVLLQQLTSHEISWARLYLTLRSTLPQRDTLQPPFEAIYQSNSKTSLKHINIYTQYKAQV